MIDIAPTEAPLAPEEVEKVRVSILNFLIWLMEAGKSIPEHNQKWLEMELLQNFRRDFDRRKSYGMLGKATFMVNHNPDSLLITNLTIEYFMTLRSASQLRKGSKEEKYGYTEQSQGLGEFFSSVIHEISDHYATCEDWYDRTMNALKEKYPQTSDTQTKVTNILDKTDKE